jgi:hypothetical protein
LTRDVISAGLDFIADSVPAINSAAGVSVSEICGDDNSRQIQSLTDLSHAKVVTSDRAETEFRAEFGIEPTGSCLPKTLVLHAPISPELFWNITHASIRTACLLSKTAFFEKWTQGGMRQSALLW